jgi:hypothetical protein
VSSGVKSKGTLNVSASGVGTKSKTESVNVKPKGVSEQVMESGSVSVSVSEESPALCLLKKELHGIRISLIFLKSESFGFGAVQRFANLVDLVKRFPTSIYLQKSASIQLKRASTSLRYRWGSLGSLGSFSSVVSKGGGSR